MKSRRVIVIPQKLAATYLLVTLTALAFLGNTIERLERFFYGVKPGVTLEGRNVSGLLRDELEKVVSALAEEKRMEPRNATLDKLTGRVLPEVQGAELDQMATIEKVLAAPAGSAVEAVMLPRDPRYTAEILERVVEPLGSYQTIASGGPGRVHNLKLGVQLVNNTVIYPGEVFSFVRTVGKPTAERGFKMAPVISGGSFSTDYGGGLCQVASTLYNAVLAAGLPVIERHPHSKRVDYVPRGRDAAVAYDYLDLKFTNDREYPIVVKGSLQNWWRLKVTILGIEGASRKSRADASGRLWPAGRILYESPQNHLCSY